MTKEKQSMPKGFRITKEVRGILKVRLGYEKFHKELDFMLRQESYLFNKVCDYFLPPASQKQVEKLYRTLPGSPVLPKIGLVTFAGVNLGRRHSGSYPRIGSGQCIPNRILSVVASWNYDNNPHKQLMWPDGDSYRDTKDKRAMLFSTYSYHTELTMPIDRVKHIPLRKEVAAFLIRIGDFEERVNNFDNLAEQSIAGMRSVKQLLEFSPKVYDVLCVVANELKPACTDLPLADTAKSLESEL